MGSTTIRSTWMDAPQWADGWAALNGTLEVPLPSLWLIDPLRAHTLVASRYRHILSEAESARAARFHHDAHRIRYQATHTALRVLLAKATQQDPATLRFVGEHHNKPRLSTDRDIPVSFNLSYTENKSMVALANGNAIGIDIEWLNRPIAIDDMLAPCFSAAEIDFITARHDGMRHRFFTLWTRKEAILKLTGEGIGEHLPFFEVLDGTCMAEKEIIGGHPPDTIYLYSFPIGNDRIGCYASTEPLVGLTAYQL